MGGGACLAAEDESGDGAPRDGATSAVRPAMSVGIDVRTLLERMTDGFVALDREWRYVYVNALGARLLGRAPDTLIGKHIWTEFPEGVGQPFHLAYERAMREQSLVTLESYYPPWDRWFLNRIYPSADGITILFRDVTERKVAELALRASEERLRAVLDAVPEGIGIIETSGAIAYANAAAQRILGLTPDEARARPLGDPSWQIRRSDGTPLPVEELPAARALARGETVLRMLLALERDGHDILVESSAAPIRGADGAVSAAAVFFADVTARERAVRTLGEREALLDAVLSAMQDGIYVFDRDLRCRFVNEAGLRTSGRTLDDLLGRSVGDVSSAPDATERVARVLAGETLPTRIVTVPTPGRLATLAGSLTALRQPDGTITGVLATTRDLTAEREALRELHAQRELAALIVESTDDLVGVVDRELRYVLWNPAAERVSGMAAREVVGRLVLDVHPSAAENGTLARIERALAGEVTRIDRPEVRVLPSGRRVWFTGTWAPLRDEQGAVVAALVTRQDVTTREEAAERVRRTESLAALGRLVGGVAHEIRNPLFGISATLEALEAKLGDREENRPFVTTMRKELRSMQTLVDELLDYGRPAPPALARGVVRDAVDEGVRATAALAAERRVDVRLAAAVELPDVLLDAARLPRLFTNVLDNAIRFAPAGSTVEVAVSRSAAAASTSAGSAMVCVAVEDRGPGFPDGPLEQVFEPFFSERQGGTGLGLAIAARIAGQHDGTIAAQRRPGGGASVVVTLPALAPAGGSRAA